MNELIINQLSECLLILYTIIHSNRIILWSIWFIGFFWSTRHK